MGRRTNTEILYEMLQGAVIRGIGNCTQVTNRVSGFLTTGIMPIAGWRNSLPGMSDHEQAFNIASVYENNKKSDEKKSDGEQLVEILDRALKEGQHVEVSCDIRGIHELVGMGHVFNAIKIDGEIKIIDCYQGFSSEPWARQAWHEPEKFLAYFKQFSISEPEESQLVDAIAEYEDRGPSKSIPVAPSRGMFSPFYTQPSVRATDHGKATADADTKALDEPASKGPR